MTKQFGNLDKLMQQDGTILGAKKVVQIAVLADEVQIAQARNDLYSVSILEKRIEDLQIEVKPDNYMYKDDKDLSSMITPHN